MFLSFLSSFLGEGIAPQEIFEYLSAPCGSVDIKNFKTGWTMGHLLAKSQNASVIMQFFELLTTLNKLGVDQDSIKDYLNSDDVHKNNIYLYPVERLRDKELYQLICNNIFKDMKDKKALAMKKEAIFNYMMTLVGEEKKEALQNALTPSHPLHEFFSIKRGHRETSLNRGMLAKIFIEFNKCKELVIVKLLASGLEKIMTNKTTAIHENKNSTIQLINEPLLTPAPPSYYSQHKTTTNTSCGIYPALSGNDHFVNPTMIPRIKNATFFDVPSNPNAMLTISKQPDLLPHNNNVSTDFTPTPVANININDKQPLILDISKGYIAQDRSFPIEKIVSPQTKMPSLETPSPQSMIKLQPVTTVEEKNVQLNSQHPVSMFTPKKEIEKAITKEPVAKKENKKQKRQAVLA
jgi:hypothetical protein